MKSLIAKEDLNYNDPMDKDFIKTWDEIAN